MIVGDWVTFVVIGALLILLFVRNSRKPQLTVELTAKFDDAVITVELAGGDVEEMKELADIAVTTLHDGLTAAVESVRKAKALPVSADEPSA